MSAGAALLLLALLTFFIQSAYAAADPADLSITIKGEDLLFMDHNGWCSPRDQGPDGMWLPVSVTNNGATPITGLEATFSPPANTVADDPVRYLGNLGPGASTDFFFFIDYSALRTIAGCTNIPTYAEPYTITVVSLNNSLTGPAVFNGWFESEGLQEAQAGGEKIGEILGPGVAVGQIMTHQVIYELTQQSNKPAFFQPSGNGDFDDQCYRLVGAEIIAVRNTIGIAVGTVDTLYFPSVNAGNSSEVEILYEWSARCTSSAATVANAWAAQISGNPWKYAEANFQEGIELPIPIAPNFVDIAKHVQVPPYFNFLDGSLVVTYTVTFNNRFTQPVLLDYVADQIQPPPGNTSAFFGGHEATSDISEINSTIYPLNGDSGLLEWYSIPQSTYLIPAEGSIDLVYTATLNYDVTVTDPQIFVNNAWGRVGDEVIGPVSARVRIDPGGATGISLAQLDIRSNRSQAVVVLLAAVLLMGTLTLGIYLKIRRRAF